MKRKLAAVLLATSMVAGLTACGGGSDAPAADDGTAADSGTAADEGTTADDGAAADEGTAAVEGAAATDSSDPWADVDTSEHVVITYMTTGDTPSGTKEKYDEMMTKLNEILTEKVNAELDINFISWTDYLSNYNLTVQGKLRSSHSAMRPASRTPYLPGQPCRPYEPVSGCSWKDNPSRR